MEVNKNNSVDNSIQVRYFIVIGLLLIIVGGILWNLFKVTIIEREKWLNTLMKQINTSNEVVVSPNRGNIYSSDGKLMSTTLPVYKLYIDFKLGNAYPKDAFMDALDSLSLCLSKKLKDRSQADYKKHLLQGLNSKSTEFKLSSKKVSYVDMREIQQFPFFRLGRNKSGLYTKEELQRHKLFGSMADRTLGNIDMYYWEHLSKGKTGIEFIHDSILSGKTGLGRNIKVGGRTIFVISQKPVDGLDIVTTIDTRIQDIVEKELREKTLAFRPQTAIAIVMETKTGEVRAITNLVSNGSGVYSEIKNEAVSGLYEPGSTFKTATMMVALEDTVCTPTTPLQRGNGILVFNGKKITDHNAGRGPTVITAEQAMWYSSNVGMARIVLDGYENNPEKFIRGLYRVGILDSLNIEISGAGNPKTTWNTLRWSKQSLPRMSYGTEVQLPPINTLAFYNAIANDGKLVRPIFTKAIRDGEKTVRTFETEAIVEKICSENTLRTIRQMLKDVVNQPDGTGKPAHSDAVTIAGKTGTAQIIAGGGVSGHNVSFCGYFPADKPKYSCIVFMHRPQGTPSGGNMCGTAFKAIAEKIYSLESEIKVSEMKADSALVAVPQVKKTEKDIKIQDGLVPNVVGMGAKDAIFILERSGLNVRIAGRGRVEKQSLTPGQRITKGQSITITLKG